VTAAQARAWPLIRQRRSTLIAAPTGSGKTLTAFLAVLDDLVHRGLATRRPADETLVVYVSPLKALSNDIRINLQNPLAGITEQLRLLGCPNGRSRRPCAPATRRKRPRRDAQDGAAHSGDHAGIAVRAARLRFGRQMLGSTRTVIVDEIHAIAASKRGSHLALSLERLQALCAEPLTRIGLSATQKPIDAVSRFLVGTTAPAKSSTSATPAPGPGHRSAAGAAVGGDGQRCLGTGLRPPRRPRPRTPHHADFRQHPAPGRTPEPPLERTPGKTPWPRTTAAWPRSCAWTPNSGSSAASCKC
jgi:Lhr-like helicase